MLNVVIRIPIGIVPEMKLLSLVQDFGMNRHGFE